MTDTETSDGSRSQGTSCSQSSVTTSTDSGLPAGRAVDQGMVIRHGMILDYQFRINKHIKSVVHSPELQTTLVHHTQGVVSYHCRTAEKAFDCVELVKNMDKLLFDAARNMYVGVCQRALMLINQQFECMYVREFDERILSAKVNPWREEVVTSGPGNITTLIFRHGGRVLTPSLVITEGLLANEDVPIFHLEDVPGKAQRCFAVVGSGVRVFLMNSGKLLTSEDKLHLKPITAVTFFRPLRFLITAAKDGTIKVWDSSWKLLCVFVGHGRAVTSLVPYPYGPMIVSGSMDCTIRVWNLATQDQVEMIPHTTPVEGLSCKPGVYRLLSYSNRQVKGWRIEQLYTQSALTGGRVLSLRGTTHPLLPVRVLAACADLAVRIVAPVPGSVITTALLPVESQAIVSLAYFAFNELLHVLNESGTISVFDTKANPSTLKSTWTTPPHLNIGSYTCLGVYETAMDEDDIEELLASDKWLKVTLEARKLSHIQLEEKGTLDKLREGDYLLLAGTQRGFMLLIDTSGGVHQFAQGTDESPVSVICCNAKISQIVSASQEGSLQVWRLYPNSVQPLSHVMSFSLPSLSPASIIVSSKDRLGVASNNTDLSSYSIDMFDLKEKVSYTSSTESSHTDVITSLDAAHKLKLFASSSLDCTVRIWTDDNYPVRVINLDSPTNGLAFCSLQADIMIALHSHVHIISNTTYMAAALQKQVLLMRLPDPVSEVSMKWTVPLHKLPAEDRQRLELVDNTISQDDYKGDLSADEMAILEEALKEKAACLERIAIREKDINDVRDGKVKVDKSALCGPLKGRERDDFWKQLLRILRPGEPQVNIRVPEIDNFDPNMSCNAPDAYQPEPQFERGPRYNFFPPLATFEPPYPLAPDGYLPNSVLLQALRKSAADQELTKSWKPLSISDKQRRLLEEMAESVEAEEEEEEQESDGELMSRLQALATAAHHSPPPSPTPPPTSSPPPPPIKKTLSLSKPIEKLIAPKAKPPKPRTPPRVHTPTPPRSPSLPPPTPLPDFIAQFTKERWFNELFPNANSSTFPRPWTVMRFISSLLKFLSTNISSITKGDICSAILNLVLQHDPGNKAEIYGEVLNLVTTPPVPSSQNMSEKYFIKDAFKLLFQLSELDGRLVAVMMLHYMQGGTELRHLVINNLLSRGLHDPEGYFKRRLDLMAGENIITATDVLLGTTQNWLQEWADSFLASKETKPKMGTKRQLKASSYKKDTPKLSKAKEDMSSPCYPDSIAVINYFVRVEHEKTLARPKVTLPPATPPEPKEELLRNTVLTLPKINKHGGLIRLGETHCSCCHPERETSLALPYRLPPHYNVPRPSEPAKLWDNFTHCLTLALRPQNINPFLTEEERRAEEEMAEHSVAGGVSVSTIMKYFVHDRSYVRKF